MKMTKLYSIHSHAYMYTHILGTSVIFSDQRAVFVETFTYIKNNCYQITINQTRRLCAQLIH